jgi:hypothetical protein
MPISTLCELHKELLLPVTVRKDYLTGSALEPDVKLEPSLAVGVLFSGSDVFFAVFDSPFHADTL